MRVIHGTGTDIVEIRRIRSLLKKGGDTAIKKIVSEQEFADMPKKNRDQYLAGRFAARESLIKAAGSRSFSLTALVIENSPEGKPVVRNPELIQEALGRDNINIHLSISHEKEYAVAFAIIEVI